MSDPDRLPAWSDDATRDEWQAYRRVGAVWIFIGALMLVPVFVIPTYMEQRGDDLLRDAERVTGAVVGTRGVFNRAITVEYEYHGATQKARINLSSSSPGYKPGQELTLLVDSGNPGNVRTLEEPNDPLWAVGIFVITAAASPSLIVGGWIVRRRARRWRRGLERAPWAPIEVEHAIARVAGHPQLVVRLQDGNGLHIMAPAAQTKWARRHLEHAAQLHIVWFERSRAVVTAEPGESMSELYTTRRTRKLRAWRAAFDTDNVEPTSLHQRPGPGQWGRPSGGVRG